MLPQMKDAPGIGGSEDLRVSLSNAFELAPGQAVRHLRLGQTVTSCGAAARIRVIQFDQFETGNCLQHALRRVPNVLAMAQMAGVVIGHACSNGVSRFVEAVGDEELADVFDFFDEARRPVGELRVAGQQFVVLLEHQAAAGHVDDYGVEMLPQALENLDVRSGELRRPGNVAGMVVNGPAAHLSGGAMHLAAVAEQDAVGGAVGPAEQGFSDAAREQSNDRIGGTGRRAAVGRNRAVIGRWLVDDVWESQGGGMIPGQTGGLDELEETCSTGQTRRSD